MIFTLGVALPARIQSKYKKASKDFIMNRSLIPVLVATVAFATCAFAQDKPSLYSAGVNNQRGGSAVASGSAQLNCYENAVVEAYQNAAINAYDTCTVTAYDNARVRANGNVKVKAHDNVRVIAADDSQVDARNSCTVKAIGRAVVVAHGNVEVYAGDNTTVKAYDHSTVYGEGNCKVEAFDKSIVHSKQNCKVINPNHKAFDVDEAIFGRMEDPAAAYREYSTRIKLNKTDELALYYRAQAGIRLGRLNSAMNDIQDALMIDPNNSRFYLVLAYIQHKQGHKQLASENVKKAQFSSKEIPTIDLDKVSLPAQPTASN